ncbi:Cytochrome c oxidase subunit IV [Paraoerskovia marina]|uniref:Cytochrome c oxidase polypeptide 4 n=1 Tax=Paraoerskovia marina TaxID=545619 RepID=A0A1H1S785_9CELL|nr:cytochrome c oxidase subunit 4 [Paraoerskovia marina]SDS43865.1 Cytochrome c oxidase subunit IV [Paraoerskovia marina]
MKVEYKVFLAMTPFYIVVGVIYGIATDWSEPVGIVGLLLTAGLVTMIGLYLVLTAKKMDDRPEDDPEGLIEEGAGDQGVYAPWSWWPLATGFSAAVVFAALAVGWWLLYIGVAIGIVALVGWVFEYSRGQHAH